MHKEIDALFSNGYCVSKSKLENKLDFLYFVFMFIWFLNIS